MTEYFDLSVEGAATDASNFSLILAKQGYQVTWELEGARLKVDWYGKCDGSNTNS